MKSARDIIIRPIVSEKSYELIEHNRYTFQVHPDAEKIEIRKAIEELFNVTVLRVNTMTMKGKPKRLGRFPGYRPGWKKAIVTLSRGDRIEFFESM